MCGDGLVDPGEGCDADADGSCGDGVTWRLTHGDEPLASGTINGSGSGPVKATREVLAGERINFIVDTDGATYFCDSTLVSARVRTHVP